MLESGQPQVGNGDEVLARPKAPCGALGLLQQPVHGLDEGVAACEGKAETLRGTLTGNPHRTAVSLLLSSTQPEASSVGEAPTIPTVHLAALPRALWAGRPRDGTTGHHDKLTAGVVPAVHTFARVCERSAQARDVIHRNLTLESGRRRSSFMGQRRHTKCGRPNFSSMDTVVHAHAERVPLCLATSCARRHTPSAIDESWSPP